MPFLDLLKLALRNLREAKLRASLTTMGVVVGVAMIVIEPLTPSEAIWANSVTIIGQIFQFTPGGVTTY